MPASWLLVALLGLWVTFGPAMGLLMRRLGHSGPMWALIGAVFGPLSVVFAVQAVGDRPSSRQRVTHRGHEGGGPVHVLAGVDGSAESYAAMQTVVELLGPQLGRLVLATVLDFDTAGPGGSRSAQQAAERTLREASECVAIRAGLDPSLAILSGRPSGALQDYALDQEVHLVAIGSRGSGMAKTVLGSVATDLARATTTPVLMVGHAPRARHGDQG